MKKRLGAVAAFVLCSFLAFGQIIEFRQIDGKSITCMRSGLSSDLKDCGAPEWYAYVFVGSISSIRNIENEEKELQITPEEVFKGAPPTPLIVKTSQAACMPPLNAGDRWLFFFRKDGDKPVYLDFYGNSSVPIESAQGQLETLRRLKGIGDYGLLRGSVQRLQFKHDEPVAGAQVVVQRFPDKLRFFATTDQEGRYEFQPLPPGRFEISVDPVGSFQADSGTVNIQAGRCWDALLTRSPHGRIAGHVRRAKGNPAAGISVVLIQKSGYNTAVTKKDGSYSFDGLSQEAYVVGVNYPDAPPWKNAGCGGNCEEPVASMYYTGAYRRSEATPIKLSQDEKRADIDFVLPH